MMNKLNPHPDRPDDTYYWRALGAVSVFLCLPVISVTYVPLVDYPNHLARAFILYNYSEVPIYQATYHRVLEPIPNLAIDLIVPFMLPFIDILVAGKIFLLLTILLFITGCHQLGKAIHGRPTWLVLPCLFFFYNSMLLYGFVNFMVGIGLFCVTVALRLRMRGRWTKSGLLKLTLLSLLACLAHLSAYAFVALTFVVVTAWDYVNGKERFYPAALSLTPLLPPIVSLLVFVTGPETSGCIELNTTSGKLLGMLALILSYNYTLDLLVAAGFLGISIVLVTRIQSLRVNGPLFISGMICVILYLLSPKAMLGGSGIDARYIMPAALLLTLSLKVSAVSRTIKFLLPLLLLLASVRVVFIWRTWVKLDKRIAVHVEHLKQLPSGTTIYPLFVLPNDRQDAKVARSLDHVVHYATIYREAVVPTLLAVQGLQPLLFRAWPGYAAPSQRHAEEWVQFSDQWMPLLANYDYVWAHCLDERMEELLRQRFTKIGESDAFTLWRVNVQAPSHFQSRNPTVTMRPPTGPRR